MAEFKKELRRLGPNIRSAISNMSNEIAELVNESPKISYARGSEEIDSKHKAATHVGSHIHTSFYGKGSLHETFSTFCSRINSAPNTIFDVMDDIQPEDGSICDVKVYSGREIKSLFLLACTGSIEMRSLGCRKLQGYVSPKQSPKLQNKQLEQARCKFTCTAAKSLRFEMIYNAFRKKIDSWTLKFLLC
uniref:Uncharacterized protein n=1 Tax=Ditylenchus dipsaci TaxID=166011 RepID=A0A915CMZ4_9BILA